MGYTVLVRPEEFENHVLPDETRSLLRDPDPSVVKQIRRECLFRRREKPKPTENDVGEFFVGLIDRHSLCPKHKATLSRFKPAKNDRTKAKVDAALYVKEEAPKDSRPDWVRCRLFIEFKRGGTSLDSFDDTDTNNPDPKAETREDVRAQLTAYAHNVFLYQHRAWLYSLLVNGEEFRVMRWDRSGVIATKKMNYFEDAKFLIRFLSYFDALTAVGQGTDPTATLVGKDSRLYELMDRYAEDNDSDMDHADGTVVPPLSTDNPKLPAPSSQSVPQAPAQGPTTASPPSDNEPTPSRPHLTRSRAVDASEAEGIPPPPSPLLRSDLPPTCDIDPHEPVEPIGGEDPRVFRYIRKKFRDSLANGWPRYALLVGEDRRVFLVGKPVFYSTTMFGRATRGYIALDVKSRRFMFLKDSWRPFYVGVEPEGVYLEQLIGIKAEKVKREVRVPRPFRHGDVEEQRSFTAAYAEWLANRAEDSTNATAGHSSSQDDNDEQPVSPSLSAKERPSTLVSHAVREPSSPTPEGTDPAPPLPYRSILGKRSRDDFDSARDEAEESGERPGSRQSEDSTIEAEQPSYRLYMHYRIAVLDVCLPFNQFTSSKQLATLMSHCLTTHRHAFEQLSLLHRDVSAGNVLILPKLHKLKGGALKVSWHGILTDWELAKVVPDDPLCEQSARQPERTGTWQFMSVAYSRTLPRPPVTVADELESFFHVMLFYAIRYLPSTAPDVGQFIYRYFDDHVTAGDTRTCNDFKANTMESGTITWNGKLVEFLITGQERNKSLNYLLTALLQFFKARYEVIRWHQWNDRAARLPSAAPATQVTSNTSQQSVGSDDAQTTQTVVEDEYEDDEGDPGGLPASIEEESRQPGAVTTMDSEPQVAAPSKATNDLFEAVKNHRTFLAVLVAAIKGSNLELKPWPVADTVPDRCPPTYDSRPLTIAHTEAAMTSRETWEDARRPMKKIKTEVSEPSELRTMRSGARNTRHATEPDFAVGRDVISRASRKGKEHSQS
ncbi:hypothetical protein C8Q77DRAFT_1145639 [Trametes polyzona]|nr:hypothetical protein C8Q77DRAFT_1145639 [Trametes polyzona]